MGNLNYETLDEILTSDLTTQGRILRKGHIEGIITVKMIGSLVLGQKPDSAKEW